MAEAFYGRIHAYEDGLAGSEEALRAALQRNVYGTAAATPAQLARIAAYLRRETEGLAAQIDSCLLAGEIAFGTP
jgi:cytochrome b pre-mRNA-processing protein 3